MRFLAVRNNDALSDAAILTIASARVKTGRIGLNVMIRDNRSDSTISVIKKHKRRDTS